MKSVLLPIKPKYCELIASGKKMFEFRKTRPKINVPFKGYIYCTKDKPTIGKWCDHKSKYYQLIKTTNEDFDYYNKDVLFKANGKVIGEFICDEINLITQVSNMMSNKADYRAVSADGTLLSDDIFDFAQLTKKEVSDYLEGRNGYALHISDLVIYDKPKELSEFIVHSKIGCVNEGKCQGCQYFDFGNGYNIEADCNAPFCTDEYKPLKRAPQSWCYVKELETNFS